MDLEVEQPEGVTISEEDRPIHPQTSITVETSSLPQEQIPEIYYGPDSEILSPGLISIKEEHEVESPRTPFHFGTRLYLYPYTPHFNTPFDLDYFQTPVDSLGNLLGHLTMAESTSQTVPCITATKESSTATSSMFTMTPESHLYGVPFIPSGYQYLSGTLSIVASSP